MLVIRRRWEVRWLWNVGSFVWQLFFSSYADVTAPPPSRYISPALSGLKTAEKQQDLRIQEVCVCVYACMCVRQCVTSRKLLSADLHNALFPLSRSEKQASFARQRRGNTRQMAVQRSRATCGYNKRAEVLNKGLSHHTAVIMCQVSHVKWKNTKKLNTYDTV